MADIENGFRIEATVKVYLHWDAERERWVVSPSTVDDYPLDTGGLYTDTDERYDALEPEHKAIWDEADMAGVPDARELWELLGDAIREADNA